jgi:DNA-directed RNA polymerase subunit M/transcription elongation factor TFIIS
MIDYDTAIGGAGAFEFMPMYIITQTIMRICAACQSIQSKSTKGNEIIFICRTCGLITQGTDDDTLISEEFYESDTTTLAMHQVFIESSAFDPAANIVLLECPRCSLNFMSAVRIGNASTTIYTCRCGYQATRAKYLTEIASQRQHSPVDKTTEKK